MSNWDVIFELVFLQVMNGPKKEKKSFKQLSQKMATMTKIDMDKKTESSQLNNGKGLFIYWQPSL